METNYKANLARKYEWELAVLVNQIEMCQQQIGKLEDRRYLVSKVESEERLQFEIEMWEQLKENLELEHISIANLLIDTEEPVHIS